MTAGVALASGDIGFLAHDYTRVPKLLPKGK